MKSENVNHSVVSDSMQPIDYSLPGSFVYGILQARILEWVAFPSPGIEPWSLASQADSLPSEPPEKPHARKFINHKMTG